MRDELLISKHAQSRLIPIPTLERMNLLKNLLRQHIRLKNIPDLPGSDKTFFRALGNKQAKHVFSPMSV
jgi:hypothetical protein